MNLKVVYFVTTSGHKWGKGLTLASALESAYVNKLSTKYRKGAVELAITLAIFKSETTDEELQNLYKCIVANQMWGSPMFYQDEGNKEYEADKEMIDRLFIGWAQDDQSFTHKK